ncbi:hypothetical protein L0F63_005981 [Massospora cicadina]|nr:hypothetical protein L0F63_005981 [Massospora cicadina]
MSKHFGQALLLADCLSGYLERVQDEGIHPTISNLVRNTQLPNWMKYTLSTLLRYVFRQPLLADTVYNSRRRTVAELWEVLVERQDTFAEFNAEWDSLKLDILILPPLACTAFLHGQMEKITGGLNYSLMANVFDLPAGVLPVTQVDPKLDKLNPHTWYTEQLGPNVTPEWLHTLMYSIYDANAISGFPVGVQVVGRQFEDEKVLAVMQLIESLLNQRKSP